MRDLIIIGGGFTGMAASSYTARKHTDALFLNKDRRGKAIWATGVDKYRNFQYGGKNGIIF